LAKASEQVIKNSYPAPNQPFKKMTDNEAFGQWRTEGGDARITIDDLDHIQPADESLLRFQAREEQFRREFEDTRLPELSLEDGELGPVYPSRKPTSPKPTSPSTIRQMNSFPSLAKRPPGVPKIPVKVNQNIAKIPVAVLKSPLLGRESPIKSSRISMNASVPSGLAGLGMAYDAAELHEAAQSFRALGKEQAAAKQSQSKLQGMRGQVHQKIASMPPGSKRQLLASRAERILQQ
jgi:hypothetical protein